MLETSETKKATIKSFDSSYAPQMLAELISEMGHDSALINIMALQEIADKLSKVANQNPPWSWRYLRNVINHNLEPSQKLVHAIFALGATIDGVPSLVASAKPIQVLAVGNITPGAVVLADSRPCARPGCSVHFVPRVPRQRYCCQECRDKDRKTI